MSKQEYNPPTGAPPNWSSNHDAQGNNGYVPQAQPAYDQHQQSRSFGGGGYGGGYQQGYGQQGYPQGGYGPPPQGGYYQQQQPMYVQQQPQSGNNDCCLGCLAALCVCCALDAIF